MRLLFSLAVFGMVTACSTAAVQPGLESRRGVTINNPGQTMRYMTQVDLHRPATPTDAETLSFCVAQAVPNENFTLEDSADSYVGVFTGLYYKQKNMREASAGNSKRFVSEDGRTVVTRGSGRYQYSFGVGTIENALIYTLAIEPDDRGMHYLFTDLQQAQLDTGSIENDGFNRVGAWPGAKPITVYDQLSAVADGVNSCIQARTGA